MPNFVESIPFKKMRRGKHVFLDAEGSGKTTSTLRHQIDVCHPEKEEYMDNPITQQIFFNTFNTIEGQREKYEWLVKDTATIWGHNHIHLIRSTSELIRKIFKEKDSELYEKLRGMKEKDKKTRLFFLRGSKKNVRLMKHTSCGRNDRDYKYNSESGSDLYRSWKQLWRKFNASYHCKNPHTMYVLVSHNGNDIENIDEIINYLSQYVAIRDNNNKLATTAKSLISLQKTIDSLIAETEGLSLIYFNHNELNDLQNDIQCNRDFENNVLEHPEDFAGHIFFYQNEKLFSSMRKLKKKNENFVRDHVTVVCDEFPVKKITEVSYESLTNLADIILKEEKERTLEEFELLRLYSDEQLKKIKKDVNVLNNMTESFKLMSKMYISRNRSYLKPAPMFKPERSGELSMFFDLFDNIIILTTEDAPATFFENNGFRYWAKDIDESAFWSNEQIEVCIMDEQMDTRKVHEKKLKKHIAENREEHHFYIGKKALKCDSTIEAIKGSNDFCSREDIMYIDVFMSPVHPNEALAMHSGNDVPLEETAIKIQTDKLNQVLGRTLGHRAKARKSNLLNPIITRIYITKFDTITIEALGRCRYTMMEK